jgi:hypothetical protein
MVVVTIKVEEHAFDRKLRRRDVFLPPYSTDLNPIEQAWPRLKQPLQGVKARVLEQLEPAVAQQSRDHFPECSGILPSLRVRDTATMKTL